MGDIAGVASVGGIVGHQGLGGTQFCVALNGALIDTVTMGSTMPAMFNRIVGFNQGGSHLTNFAIETMQGANLAINPPGAASPNGATVTSSDIISKAYWDAFIWWRFEENSPWRWDDTLNRPVLI